MPHEPAPPIGVSISILSQRARLVTIPGTEARRTSSEALRLAGIHDGDSLRAAELAQLLADAEPKAAMNRAMRLLGHRERSRRELTTRLQEDGYASELIRETLERLEDLGCLDDRRFAEAFVSAKHSAGWGRMRIEKALHEKGVDAELMTEVLESQVPEAGEKDRALAALGKTDVEDQAHAARALRRLLSRGFSRAASNSAIASRRNGADD